MSITAVILSARASRRLKNKNIALLAGTNLLINKINQIKWWYSYKLSIIASLRKEAA